MEFHKVVVGVDFSAASIAAARWAATHLAPRAELVLVHVLPEPEAPPFVRPYLPSMLELVEELAPSLYGGLRGVAELIDVGRTRLDMRAGVPAAGLARAAADAGADLICLGRTRSRRGSARFGATTAQRLLAGTQLPVLVVPAVGAEAAGRAGPPARILAAIDARPSGWRVVHGAWRIALACEARVDALHVLAPELPALVRAHRHAGEGADSTRRLSRHASGDARARGREEPDLFHLTREWIDCHLDAVGAPPTRARACVRVGDPGQEIVAFAHVAGADLIAMGRGGDGPGAPSPPSAPGATASSSGAVPLGSTTRLVMWAAPCPVLVLPGAPPRQDPTPATVPGRRARRAIESRSFTPQAADTAAGPCPPAARRPMHVAPPAGLDGAPGAA
jgi:nucleotide-binding universal stress UspA family protein